MEELKKLVTQKAGLSVEQAQAAIETVVGFLKSKLPAPVAGQVDAVLSGNMPNMGDMAQNLGGMFGKK